MVREYLLSVVIIILLCTLVGATTFLPQSFDELDKKATHILIGTVVVQKSIQESKVISTETTLHVEEWLKGTSSIQTVIVKEPGGSVGDVLMVVPGSAQFVPGEHVVIFFEANKKTNNNAALTAVLYGHTVGMAQGKFSIQKDKSGTEVLINDLGGAHLLKQVNHEQITLTALRAKYKPSLFRRIIQWMMWVFQ